MNPLLRRSAAHVFVDSLLTPTLNADDQHHLARVLRLRAGESVSVSDGQGRWRICRFVSADVLEPDTEIETVERVVPEITIGFALPKGDRPEWIVQKLTEIGVDHVVVLHAERSVVRWEPDRAERNIAKLVKVAREASMQSRRVWLPTVSGPLRADQVAGGSVSLAEPDGDALTLAATTVLIGPEGGWTPNELNITASHVSLGKSILRVETAALVAAANLSALRDR
ncbi:MAG: RsmE family RNA methyltransferase [Actinobacteria bacterium]|uniref:16S rRNA (uracil(1498)-N(3))-methyltransferase n=1 Tax=freshwater metagenome TaxID=449393 RepID=A0A6J6XAM0_9ZZZZ|nr:RsmE family RNA methyltransferase [Actinomycetota bacterium]